MRQFKLSRVSTPALLAAVIGISHTYALVVFGATFWIDSIEYVNLAESLRSAGALSAFYDGVGTWLYSHLQPGIPLLWLATSALPETFRWPAIALVQHSLAAYASYLAFTTLDRYWPSRVHVWLCVVLSFLPFYQSLHNAILTESLTSSLLMISFSLSLRIGKESRFPGGAFIGLVTSLLLITQIRGYFGLIVSAFALLALGQRRLLVSRYAVVCLVAAAVSAFAFPLYRYQMTGRFLVPSRGMNALIAGLWVDPTPGDAVRRAFQAVPFPNDLSAEKVLDEGLDYDQAIKLAAFWRSSGLSDTQVNERAETLGQALRADGGGVYVNRLVGGLVSCGAVSPHLLLDSSYVVFRGWTAQKMYAHQVHHYRYLSWVSARAHTAPFNAFFRSPSGLDKFALQSNSKQLIVESQGPYLSDTPVYLRNVMLLGSLPPDLWVLLGLTSLLLLLRQERYFAALIVIAVVVNFAVAVSFPLDNVRYAYPFFPLYLLTLSVAAAGPPGYFRSRGPVSRAGA